MCLTWEVFFLKALKKKFTKCIIAVFVMTFVCSGMTAYGGVDEVQEQPYSQPKTEQQTENPNIQKSTVGDEKIDETAKVENQTSKALKSETAKKSVSKRKNVPRRGAPQMAGSHKYKVDLIWPSRGHNVFESKYKDFEYTQMAYLTFYTDDKTSLDKWVYLKIKVGENRTVEIDGPETLDGKPITYFDCSLYYDKNYPKDQKNPFRFGYSISGNGKVNENREIHLYQVMANNVDVELNMPKDVQDLNTLNLKDLLSKSAKLKLYANDYWNMEYAAYIPLNGLLNILSNLGEKTLTDAKNLKTGQFNILDWSLRLQGKLSNKIKDTAKYGIFNPFNDMEKHYKLIGSMQDDAVSSINAQDSYFIMDGDITGDDLNGWLMKLKIADKYIKTVTTKPSDKAIDSEKTVKLVMGDTLKTPIPNPTPKDEKTYKFAGWFTDEALTKAFDATAPINEDTTLYAKWERKTPEKPDVKPVDKCKITFDLNGGKLSGKTKNIVKQCKVGEKITIIKAPVRSGYKFLYWKGSKYSPGQTYEVKGDHTFTAQWEKVASTGNSKDGEKAIDGHKSPRTGDSMNIAMYLSAAIVGGLVLLLVLRRKSNQ